MFNVKVGSRIKFEEDNLWFTVQAFDSRYIICTSETKLGLFHTIVDLEKDIRGDDNLVFHSGYDTVELCEQRLKEFITGELEISHRNYVQLNIVKFQQ